MRTFELSLPEIAVVAGTRGMLGAGIGLIVSNFLQPGTRKAVGWTLFAIGALTTIPIATTVFGRSRGRLPAD